jgi:type II secretory pathway pseudopilin PulG
MIKNKKQGYTLVELLAVIIILVTVGTIISAILASVLRSSNKSVNTESVRRNGNYAITQMSKMIAYAQKLEGVSLDGSQYYTDCVSQPASAQYNYLRIKSFDGGITTFACNDSKIASLSASETNYLVDPVLNAACYFKCTQESAAAPAKIDIFLNLSVQNSANFSEGQVEIPFETSVIILNSGGR